MLPRFDTFALWLRLSHRAWRYRLRVERPEIAFMLRHLRRGQTAIDVGAHKGAFTYWMNRIVGDRGRVFAFEPLPDLADYLRKLHAHRVLPQVTVIEGGLSDRTQTAELFLPEEGHHLGTSTLEARSGRRAIDITTYRLDDFVREHRVDNVSFIKCDVEGHELQVFQGAEQVLSEHRPVLLFECHDGARSRNRRGHVFDFLRQFGYRGHFFFQGELRPIEQLGDQLQQNPGGRLMFANFAFLPARQS